MRNTSTASLAKRNITSRAHDTTPTTPQGIEREKQIQAMEGRSGAFRKAGDFYRAIVNAGTPGGHTPDVRLGYEAALPSLSGSESSGQDGGYLVPAQFSNDVMRKVVADDGLLMQCDVRTTKTGALSIPKDETTPWQVSAGVQAYWQQELANLGAVASKPLLTATNLRCHKLITYVPISDELQYDSDALAEHVSAMAPSKISFKVEQAIIQGTGAGQPLGITKSTATVTVAKEAGQANGTIVNNNVIKLYNSLTPIARKNAIFIVSPDADVQLQQLSQTITTTTGVGAPIYQPPTKDAPWGSLLGKPIYISEGSPALGSPGDIICADMDAYIVALGKYKQTISTDVYFDYDMSALKFVLRIDGSPYAEKLIPSLAGGGQRGFFAMLAQR